MAASNTATEPQQRNMPRRSANTVTLRRDADHKIVLFQDLADDFGATSNLEMARRLGCGEGTVSRLRNDEQQPGLGFVAGVVMLYANRPDDRPLTRHFNFGTRGQR